MIAQSKKTGHFYHYCRFDWDGELTIAVNHESEIAMVVDKDKVKDYSLFYTEEEKDKEVTDLKRQIEELKAKVPQPVEISGKLKNVIGYIKRHSGEWESVFLNYSSPSNFEFFNKEDAKVLMNTGYLERLNIIKNGYTVKPDPLREGIASLVARYTNEDGVTGETDLIEKLAEYVRSHFGGETE